jgi:hypothetical protein
MQPVSGTAWWVLFSPLWLFMLNFSFYMLHLLEKITKRLDPFDVLKVPETQKYAKTWFHVCKVKTKIKGSI